MRKPSKKVKVVCSLLFLLALIVGFCATQFYTIQIKDPAYEGSDWGLRPSRKGDLALVWTHLFRKSIGAGDLALLESHDPGRAEQFFVRRIDRPLDARMRRFSWIEFRAESPDGFVYEPGSNVRIVGRVVCLIRMPGAFR